MHVIENVVSDELLFRVVALTIVGWGNVKNGILRGRTSENDPCDV